MDRLQECAKAFEKLFDVQYHIIIGRKGKTVDLRIGFEPVDFHHLLGLHKLRDLRLSRGNREQVYYDALAGKIQMAQIASSHFFPVVKNRVSPFNDKDYTTGQAAYTMLFKEKITVRTREKLVQYDRLSPLNPK